MEIINFNPHSKKENKFNIIVTKKQVDDISLYLHCPFHPGSRLIVIDNGKLLKCPQCGIPYKQENLKHDQAIKSKYGKHRTFAVSQNARKRKKKFTDSTGNPIPEDDKDIIAEIGQGHTVISYHEYQAT